MDTHDQHCRHCGEKIILVNYALGAKWMHDPYDQGRANDLEWHCATTVAEPVTPTVAGPDTPTARLGGVTFEGDCVVDGAQRCRATDNPTGEQRVRCIHGEGHTNTDHGDGNGHSWPRHRKWHPVDGYVD